MIIEYSMVLWYQCFLRFIKVTPTNRHVQRINSIFLDPAEVIWLRIYKIFIYSNQTSLCHPPKYSPNQCIFLTLYPTVCDGRASNWSLLTLNFLKRNYSKGSYNLGPSIAWLSLNNWDSIRREFLDGCMVSVDLSISVKLSADEAAVDLS